MVSLASQLEDRVASYFELNEPPPFDRWSEQNVYLPYGERRGYINMDLTPWAREPVNSLNDPEVEIEAGVYGAQLVKTTQAMCVALGTVTVLRQSVVWMWPKEAVGRSFSQSRFQPVVNSSPTLRAQKPDDHDLFKNLELHFRTGGILNFVGSRSRVDQKSRPAQVAIVDEIEDIVAGTEKEADPITSLKERSKTFLDRKMFLFGSCLLEDGPAWSQFLLGDQRHFFVPCPHCGTRQALEFRGPVWLFDPVTGNLERRGQKGDFRVWWDHDAARLGENDFDFDVVRRTACYVCANCGEKIHDHHKPAMLLAGRWHPTCRAKVYGQRSRRINSLYPLWPGTSFANFAIEFLNSLTSTAKLQNFTNNWEAKPWTTGLDLTDKDAVNKRVGYLVTDAERGAKVGLRSLLLVDVQRTYLVWALFGFDDAGQVHLRDCGYTRDFASLREKDDELQPDFVAVDARYRHQEVYTAVHERRSRWIVLRGEKNGAPLSPNFNFDPFTGDRAGRQGLFVITMVHLNTYAWGEEFLNRLYPAKQDLSAVPGAQPGLAAEMQGDPEAPRIPDFHVFAGFGGLRDFVTQLFSEYLVDYIDPRGKQKRKWKESKNNHLFDLCKYAYAIGSFLGFTHLATTARKQLEAAIASQQKAQPELPLTTPAGGTPLFPSA